MEERKFAWYTPQQESFWKRACMFCSKSVLAIFDFKREHQVHTDAGSVGLAGVLLESTSGEKWQPVFYLSQHTTETGSVPHGPDGFIMNIKVNAKS